MKLFADAILKPENHGIPRTIKSPNSEELFDQSQSTTPYYSSSIITRNKLNSPKSNLFIPVNSPPARIGNLMVDDPENRACKLQQPFGFKRTAEFTSE